MGRNARLVYEPFFCRFCKIPVEAHYYKWGWACKACVTKKSTENTYRWRNKYPEKYAKCKEKLKINGRDYRTKASTRSKALVNIAKAKPCADCGVQYPYYVMDFDHVRGEKVFTIATKKCRYLNAKILQSEIDKCEVVCSNCHRERTYKRKQAKLNIGTELT